MTSPIRLLTLTVGTALSIAISGCLQSDPGAPTGGETVRSGDARGQHHSHPAEGPHHGELIELGNEEYHAELLHDETQVTIYVLDGAAAGVVAITAADLTLNHVHDGEPMQFVLTASPQADDPDGRSSRFVSDDPDLLEHLEEEEAEFRLQITIDGKAYTGRFRHDHHHHGHAH